MDNMAWSRPAEMNRDLMSCRGAMIDVSGVLPAPTGTGRHKAVQLEEAGENPILHSGTRRAVPIGAAGRHWIASAKRF